LTVFIHMYMDGISLTKLSKTTTAHCPYHCGLIAAEYDNNIADFSSPEVAFSHTETIYHRYTSNMPRLRLLLCVRASEPAYHQLTAIIKMQVSPNRFERDCKQTPSLANSIGARSHG
jgi:hypothetical protein